MKATCGCAKIYLNMNAFLRPRAESAEINGGREIPYPVLECREVGDDRGQLRPLNSTPRREPWGDINPDLQMKLMLLRCDSASLRSL